MNNLPVASWILSRSKELPNDIVDKAESLEEAALKFLPRQLMEDPSMVGDVLNIVTALGGSCKKADVANGLGKLGYDATNVNAALDETVVQLPSLFTSLPEDQGIIMKPDVLTVFKKHLNQLPEPLQRKFGAK